MQFQITPNQNFCTFDGQTVYQFIAYNDYYSANPCYYCAFCGSLEPIEQTDECFIAPCNGLNRNDKKDGFWVKSQIVDYQLFVKMLQTEG